MKQLLILSIFLTSIFAQGQLQRKNSEDMEKMEMRKKRVEQLQNQKESTMIGLQTNYLDLSPEQAQQFFPMQKEYKDQVREAQKQYREKVGKLRSKAKDVSKFDVDTAIKYQLEMKEELAKLESEFLKSTTKVLSNEQRTKLVFQEERMKSEATKRVANRTSEISKRKFDRKKN
ncbi:MAG: hypothetical protein O3A49_04070 [Candidatus Marinimicrobia bacterium]|nr:hypothetical protein [Candidatus Neomarinimicrobiota bacterium]MDA0753835.1 hypothetical protein [Candidatus Neomarinimicrobiota bacterium]MDA1363841.1 hypothetical protein [Candidatus Neomarinimicrobiota bacterium]